MQYVTQRYRPPGEADQLRAERDPLAMFIDRVIREGWLKQAKLTSIDAVNRTLIEAAVAIAMNAPGPSPDGLTDNVYARRTSAHDTSTGHASADLRYELLAAVDVVGPAGQHLRTTGGGTLIRGEAGPAHARMPAVLFSVCRAPTDGII